MPVRNCREIGENLKKIMERLLADDKLVNLLYYTDVDPLSKPPLTALEKRDNVFNKLIKIVPKVVEKETTQSIITLRVDGAAQLKANSEFKTVNIAIEVFVPWETWLIKDTNLRPFAILGEIQESLEGKTINGLGKIVGGDFTYSYCTNEVACYQSNFTIIAYD